MFALSTYTADRSLYYIPMHCKASTPKLYYWHSIFSIWSEWVHNKFPLECRPAFPGRNWTAACWNVYVRWLRQFKQGWHRRGLAPRNEGTPPSKAPHIVFQRVMSESNWLHQSREWKNIFEIQLLPRSVHKVIEQSESSSFATNYSSIAFTLCNLSVITAWWQPCYSSESNWLLGSDSHSNYINGG